MGLRIQAYLLGVSLALISSFSMALGLGEITIQSSLNEPLRAEVALLRVRSLTDQELVVGLASAEAFERSGVERAHFLFDMKFTVDLENAKGPRVIVTSTKSVTEPFLNFILEAQWPSGRLLREYTVLVDLPVFSGQRAAPVRATSRPPSSTGFDGARNNAPRKAVSRAPVSKRRPSAPVESYDGETYGPVKSSDTLWDIAQRVRPGNEVSVQQTMLALQRLNPEAFINNNINLLRRGQVLRVPTVEDVSALSSRDAIREVAVQNREWNNRDGDFSSGRAQLEGSKSFTPTRTESSSPEGRLKLSSKSEGEDSGQALGEEGSESGGGAALSATQEELDATRRENAELRDRIKAMEEQVQTMEKLLEVSSEEMRALELSAAKVNEETEAQASEEMPEGETAESEVSEEGAAIESAEESLGAETMGEEPAQGAEAESTEQAAEETMNAEPVAEPVAPVEAAQPAPKKPAPKEKSIVDLLMENILYVGLGIAGLLVAIVGFLMMRNKDDGFDDDEFDEFEPSFDAPEAVDAEPEFEQELEIETTDTVVLGDDLGAEDDATEAETEDVVAECDIHIAYGQYDQAEEKLVHALEKEPSNDAARLKLLEVLAATGSAAGFDRHFAFVKSGGDESSIARAEQLRSTIDGIGPFDETAHLGVSADFDAAQGLDFSDLSEESSDDSDLGDDTLSFDTDSTNTLLDTQDEGLSLDLDDATQETAVDTSDIDAVDFDLDFDSAATDTVVSDPTLEGDIEGSLELESADETLSLDTSDGDLDLGEELSLSSLDEGAEASLELVSEEIPALDEEPLLSEDLTTIAEAGDELGDINLDLEDSSIELELDDVDLNVDDVELDVDLGDLEEPQDSFDTDPTNELSDSLSEELSSLDLDEDVTQIRQLLRHF